MAEMGGRSRWQNWVAEMGGRKREREQTEREDACNDCQVDAAQNGASAVATWWPSVGQHHPLPHLPTRFQRNKLLQTLLEIPPQPERGGSVIAE